MDYVEAFKNLRTNNKWGRKSPHKAVLMLSVIKLYEQNILTDNEIFYDEKLKSMFLKVWNRVLPKEPLFHQDAYLPFWYLQNDSFWHIVPKRGKEDILSLMRDTNIKPSEAKLNDSVEYAELDEDLYFLMTIASGRSSLKRALLETYTQLSECQIDKMAESADNFVDHSLSAMNEYEQILSSKNNDETTIEDESSSELEKLFKKLSDDLQIALSYEYFAFLKNHRSERDMLRDVCPNVYTLYDCIISHPIRRTDISPSFAFIYENFLSDLKISLMSENGSMELIDKIEDAVAILRGDTIERDDVDDNNAFQEAPNSIQRYEEDGEHAPLLPSKDEQLPSNKNYTIDNQNKRCYIIDNFGEKVFSSSGKLIILDEEIYRVCYTNTNINMHLVRKDERGMYTLGKRVLSVRVYSPLYSVLDDMDNINQIKAVKFDRVNEEYHVLVGDRWYGSSGYYADFEQREKIVTPNIDVLHGDYSNPSDNETGEVSHENNEDFSLTGTEVEHVFLDAHGKVVSSIMTSNANLEKDLSKDNRKGKPWTKDEEEQIQSYYKKGVGFKNIAAILGRTEVAIKSRLAKLGLIEYTYGEDDVVDKPSNDVVTSQDEFKIENSFTRCTILNKNGEKVFTADGKLKYIHGKLYRLNLKDECFSIKEMLFNGEIWIKGNKKIVAYPSTKLYGAMDDALDYSEAIEDIVDSHYFKECRLKVNGEWYNYKGELETKDTDNIEESNAPSMSDSDKQRIVKHPLYAVRKQAILRAMEFFRLPAKIKDIARTISRTAWRSTIQEDEVEEVINTMKEVESVDGKYYLRKSGMKEEDKNTAKRKVPPMYENEITTIPKKKSKVGVGNMIKWLPTGVVGKVVGFKYSGSLQKIVLRLKEGSEMEVYDNPKVYEIIM